MNVTISREIRRIEVTKGWQVSHEDRQMYVVRANGVEFGPYCDRTHAERIACELRAAIRERE